MLWNGLRAAGRAIIFVALAVGIGVGLQFAFHIERPAPGVAFSPERLLIRETIALVAVFVATLVMALAERRSVWSYGLTDAKGGARYAVGLLWGFLGLSVLVGLIVASGHMTFDGRALSGIDAWSAGAEWLLVFLVVALAEELLFRGYLLQVFTRQIGFWPAAVLTSVAFGVLHALNPGEGLLGLIVVCIGGLVFCYSIRRYGSLWFAIGFHTSWDWAQSYFYGTPASGLLAARHLFTTHVMGAPWLSGGTVGPEGSALVIPVLLAMVPVISWLRRDALLTDECQ